MKAVEQNKKDDGNMTLLSHLSECRRRIGICAAVFLIGTLVCMVKVKAFSELLISRAPEFDFVYTAPAELFVVYMRLAITGGALAAVPVCIFELWQFLKPGLLVRERNMARFTMIFGLLLFFLGAVFAFEVVIPFSLRFFYGLNNGEKIVPMMSIESYIAYITEILISFGIVFEFPVVVVLLTNLGLLRSIYLRKNRKYIILIIFVIAAIITPPDVTSQLLIAIPMLALFEISILLSDLVERRVAKKDAVRS